MRQLSCIAILISIAFISCSPPPDPASPTDSSRSGDAPRATGSANSIKTIEEQYAEVTEARSVAFKSAAYLLDLRINDNGEKFTVTTELYFSGDSVGFYGRGYFGKGTFKGSIINDLATIYFPDPNEYYQEMVGDFSTGAECADASEVLIYVLSQLGRGGGGENHTSNLIERVAVAKNEFMTEAGRFNRYLKLNKAGIPIRDKLIDPICGDSIVFRYYDQKRKFPFYKIENLLYYNEPGRFRARGFVREQKYNIQVRSSKFSVEIPPSARRIVSF